MWRYRVNTNNENNLITCKEHIDKNIDMLCDACDFSLPISNYIEEKELETKDEFGEKNIQVSGKMPKETNLEVVEIQKIKAANIAKKYKQNIKEENIIKALDIKLLANNKNYQPKEINEKVNVKLSNLNLDDEKTYAMMHIIDEENYEILPVNILNDNELEFKTSSFSTYILITVGTKQIIFEGENYKVYDSSDIEITNGATIAEETNISLTIVPNDGYGISSLTCLNTATESVGTISGYVKRQEIIIDSITDNLTINVITALAPKITAQPVSFKGLDYGTATFTIEAENATTYYWQYRENKDDYWKAAGSTSATLSVSSLDFSKSGYEYRCLVGNDYFANGERVISDSAVLSVAQNPATIAQTSARVNPNAKIIKQPVSLKVLDGTTAKFTIEAENAIVYKWQYRESKNDYWKKVGSSSATLSISANKAMSGYEYRCLVENYTNHERVESDIVVLSVTENPSHIAPAKAKVITPIEFTTQPTSQKVLLSEKATFTFEVQNATSYEWQYKKSGDSSWKTVDNTIGNVNGKTLTVDTSSMTVDENFNLNNNLSGTKFRVVAKNSSIQGYLEKSDVAVLSVAQGETKTGSVKVKPTINNTTIEVPSEERIYNGSSYKPTVSVKYGDKDLILETDYTVTYGENINAGKGTIIVKGVGDYGGEKEIEFTISPQTVEIPQGKILAYNGVEQIGVEATDKYTAIGNKATEIGEYYATVELVSTNYIWNDGTTLSKTIAWKIKEEMGRVSVSLKIGADDYNGEWTKNSVQAIVNVPENIPNLTDVYYKKSSDTAYISFVNTMNIKDTIVLIFDETINEQISFVGVDVTGKEVTLPSDAYSIKIDKTKPVINEVSSVQNGNKVIMTANVKDEGSFVKYYALSNNNVMSEWIEINSAIANGDLNIEIYESGIYYLWVKDIAGNISLEKEITIYKDIDSPIGSVEIIGNIIEDETYVNNKWVTLKLTADDDITENNNMKMKLYNKEDYEKLLSTEDIVWEDFEEEINWPLTDGDGEKTVYLILKDEAGNTSVTVFHGEVNYVVHHFLQTEDGTSYDLYKTTNEKVLKGRSVILSNDKLPIPGVTYEKSSLSYMGSAVNTIIPNEDGTTEIFMHYTRD